MAIGGMRNVKLVFLCQCVNIPHVDKTQYIVVFRGFYHPQYTRYGVKNRTLQNMYFHKFFENFFLIFHFLVVL